jgi:DNA-directed RNA polymerase specialized sigma24 family protein
MDLDGATPHHPFHGTPASLRLATRPPHKWRRCHARLARGYNVSMLQDFASPSLSPACGRAFATTHWSLMLAAGDTQSPQAKEALETLCRAYWYPLYAYVRRKGYDAHSAQDLIQEFFARLLARNYLSVADRNRGKFRSFLLGSLEHFLAREWTKGHAQKRGGGQTVLSLDRAEAENRYRLEPSHELTPAKIFDRRWATTLLDQAMTSLTNADLSGANLTDAELEGATLTNADLSGTNLTDADLGHATLTNANLAGAIVTKASFANTSGLTSQQLHSTASYQQRDLWGIVLSGHDLTGVDFSGQNLTGANFDMLTNADLSGTNLTDASLWGATLTNANLAGAMVTGANFGFDYATSQGFTKEQLYSTASYQQRNLRDIGLGLNDLTGWDFSALDLAGADFTASTLISANFAGAVIAGANFGALD